MPGCVGDKRNSFRSPDTLHGPADMLGSGSAAASYCLYTHGGNFFHPGGEGLRVDVIDRAPVFGAGESGVGIDQNRYRCHLRHALHDGNHLLGSHTAVHTEAVDTQSFQHGDRGIHRTAGQQFPAAVIDICDQDRQVAVFFGSQNSSLGFIAVAHGLDQNQIGTCRRADPDDFPEKFHCLFKRQVAQGLQKPPGRSYVQRDVGVLAVCPPAGFPGQADSRLDDLTKLAVLFFVFTQSGRLLFLPPGGRGSAGSGVQVPVRTIRRPGSARIGSYCIGSACAGSGEFQRVRSECICIENITACLQISAVQIDDILRPGEVPSLREFSPFEAFLLQDRTCSAVKKKPLFPQTFQ